MPKRNVTTKKALTELVRVRFLETVREVVPAVLYDLRDGPWPIYRSTALLHGADWAELQAAAKESINKKDVAVEMLRELTRWAERCHLVGARGRVLVPSAWACEAALQTLQSWVHYQSVATTGKGNRSYVGALHAGGGPFAEPPEWAGNFREAARRAAAKMLADEPTKVIEWWSPLATGELWGDYEARMMSHLRRERDREIQRLKGFGLEERSAPSDMHLKWLALRQCAQLSYPDIAKRHCGDGKGPSADAVRKAVESVALLLRLEVQSR
jgi:hypothetical protein